MVNEYIYECIISLEPYGLVNEANEVCVQAKKVQKLVRCGQCTYMECRSRYEHFCTMLRMNITHGEFFCAYGEERKVDQ